MANGLPGHGSKLADAVPALSQALLREAPGRKLADAVPSLSQSLLGEVPLWICQSCRKSVEEEERRAVQEQSAPVSRERMHSERQIMSECLSIKVYFSTKALNHGGWFKENMTEEQIHVTSYLDRLAECRIDRSF